MKGCLKLILILSAFPVLISNGASQLPGTMPGSKHFKLVPLADGVYAAVAEDSGGAVANAGIVDLGDKILIFDTMLAKQASMDLAKAAEVLFPGKHPIVVNSHYHNDHIWGNQHFPEGATIVATEWTREAALKNKPPDVEKDRRETEAEIVSAKEEMKKEKNPLKLREMRMNAGYYTELLNTAGQVRIITPNLAFTGEMEIYGGKREARLVAARGSTPGDLYLYLPAEKILFSGDLIFDAMHPFMNESIPEEWLASLKRMEALEIRKLIPGHGPVGDAAALKRMVLYLETVRQTAKKLAEEKKKADDLSGLTVPAPFDGWAYGGIFRRNVRFVFDQLSKK